MASHREFRRNGPSFLTAVDWNNFQHRQSVAASLVQGVYTHEHDRRKNRQGPQAPPWWEFFNFSLVEVLADKNDSSYFAAVFEYMMNSPHRSQPRYVIAFRGTINSPQNMIQDYKHNGRLIINKHIGSCRFKMGLEKVFEIVGLVGHENVWLAGHSLGSALALAVGRQMIKNGVHLETYLFNPPFISLPIERLFKNADMKLCLRVAYSFLTAVAAAAAGNRNEAEAHFAVLSTWMPYMFVNTSDHICSEYVAYFKQRKVMDSIGAPKMGRLDTMHSIGSIFSSTVGKKDSCEAQHLIPSAHLTVNAVEPPMKNFKEAHGISQWWRQDCQFNTTSEIWKP